MLNSNKCKLILCDEDFLRKKEMYCSFFYRFITCHKNELPETTPISARREAFKNPSSK